MTLQTDLGAEDMKEMANCTTPAQAHYLGITNVSPAKMKSPAPIPFAAFKASSDTCTTSNNQV